MSNDSDDVVAFGNQAGAGTISYGDLRQKSIGNISMCLGNSENFSDF
jgi:hypothetical protein